jgi:hypothetical protein
LLFHEVSLLIQNLFDPFVNSLFHLFGFRSLILLCRLHIFFIILNLFSLLLHCKFILHVFLPEIVYFFRLFVDFNLSLSDLIDQLVCLLLLTGNKLDLGNILSFQYFSFDLHFCVLISLNY